MTPPGQPPVILVLSGGGFQGQGLFEVVRRIDGARTIVGDIHEEGVTRYLCADYRRLPLVAERDAFLAALQALIDEEGVSAIYPSTVFELRVLADMREAFRARGVSVAVSTPEALAVLLDKHATATFLAAYDIPTHAGRLGMDAVPARLR